MTPRVYVLTITLLISLVSSVPAYSGSADYEKYLSPRLLQDLNEETNRFHQTAAGLHKRMLRGEKQTPLMYEAAALDYIKPLQYAGEWNVAKPSRFPWKFGHLISPAEVRGLKNTLAAIYVSALQADHLFLSRRKYSGTNYSVYVTATSNFFLSPSQLRSPDLAQIHPAQAYFLHNPTVMCLYYHGYVFKADSAISYGHAIDAIRHYKEAIEVLDLARLAPRFDTTKERQRLTRKLRFAQQKQKQLSSHGRKLHDAYYQVVRNTRYAKRPYNDLKNEMPPYLAELLPPDELPEFRFKSLAATCRKQ